MKHEFEIACNATEAAGKLLLQFYDSDYTIEDKGPSPMYDRDSNPVTEADYAADTFLKRSLLGEFPDYGWLSEETADSADRLSKERVWVVDPLDGTRGCFRFGSSCHRPTRLGFDPEPRCFRIECAFWARDLSGHYVLSST